MPTRHASCQCGKVTATIADKAKPAIIACHCLDCQRRSGSPFGVIAYYPRDKVVLEGAANRYSRPTDEGNIFTHGFCPACGSTVWATTSKLPDRIGIATGAFADPLFGKPDRSVYERSRHHWIALAANVPRHPMGRNT